MKLPWTPAPRTASLEELREQLSNAKATHADAQKATSSAQAAFDDAGDPSAEKALLAARGTEQSIGEHLARAERLFAAADAARRAEERAELERKRDDLASKLSRAAITDAGSGLADAEYRARRAVADIVTQRLALTAEFRKLQHELRGVHSALGMPAPATDDSEYASALMPVRARLESDIAALLPTDRQLANLLRDLLPINY
ncbi:MAG TPA: hypothetical protein VGM29_11315 [Polyangiaceae bacterium]